MDSSTPENTPAQELQDIPNNSSIPPNEETAKTDSGEPLNSLSPISDADKDGHYSAMLLWALNNREEKDIKNIAITGPYGSGKSSVLKTFERKNSNDKLVFLNISLATFKEEKGIVASKIKASPETKDGKKKEIQTIDKDGESTSSPTEKQAMLRLVELSILQQIFYHEKDETIPDTRFKKTRNLTEQNAETLTWGVFLFVASLLYIFYGAKIWALVGLTPNKCVNIFFNVLALATIMALGFSFIRKSIRPLRSIQLKKFNLQDAEFAVDENISKSILNEHLDEILYFFEVTDYTVVVFEDLDRFQQTEIFTKLRELNHLINYSKKMNGRKVAFVYAVRDEMFQDKDRTKFFDFIIPIIPVINSSNSNEILRDIVKRNDYNIKEDLLDNIALYVDDLRLLYNIMNEFHLYRKNLDKDLDQNKLLGILIYKNIYPNDFVELSNNAGVLFGAIHKKDDYVDDKTSDLNNQITELKKDIKSLEDVAITNTNELRKLYVLAFLQNYPTATGFKLHDISYEIKQLSEEAVFNLLMEDVDREYTLTGYPYTKAAPVKFTDIEKLVHPKFTYVERLQQIYDLEAYKIDEKKHKITFLESQISSLKHKPIHMLLKADLVEIKMDDPAQKQLVSVLLRGDYINESYQDFISIFYEGSLTRTDRTFVLNVKGHNKNELDFKLNKIEHVIKRIPDFEFESHYVLNYSLVEFILATPQQKDLIPKVIRLLADESETSILFIDGFINYTKNLNKFINLLVKDWTNYWTFISKGSHTVEMKSLYFKLLLEHGELSEIKKVAAQSDLAKDISGTTGFLSLFKNEDKLNKIIKTLGIKFNILRLADAPSSLVDLVFTDSHYRINEINLETWMVHKSLFIEQEFNEQNYSVIRRNKDLLQPMIDYIHANKNAYIADVWLNLDGAKNEDPAYVWYLIEHDDVKIDLKRKLLNLNQRKFDDFSEFSKLSNMQLLLETNMVAPTWENLIRYFYDDERKINQPMIDFINDEKNAKVLIGDNVAYLEEDPEDVKLTEEFAKQFVLSNSIDDKYYGQLIVRMPWYYSNLDFSSLTKAKAEMLIEILFVNSYNYDILRGNFANLHIKLLEKDPNTVVDNLDDFAMDTEDIALILPSKEFNTEQKNTVVHQLDDTEIIEDIEVLKKVGRLAAVNDQMVLSDEIVTAVLKTEIPVNSKVSLYLKKDALYDKSEFFELVQYFGDGFEEIKPNGKQAVIPDTELFWRFAKTIYMKGYIYEPKEDKKGIRIRNIKL